MIKKKEKIQLAQADDTDSLLSGRVNLTLRVIMATLCYLIGE